MTGKNFFSLFPCRIHNEVADEMGPSASAWPALSIRFNALKLHPLACGAGHLLLKNKQTNNKTLLGCFNFSCCKAHLTALLSPPLLFVLTKQSKFMLSLAFLASFSLILLCLINTQGVLNNNDASSGLCCAAFCFKEQMFSVFVFCHQTGTLPLWPLIRCFNSLWCEILSKALAKAK